MTFMAYGFEILVTLPFCQIFNLSYFSLQNFHSFLVFFLSWFLHFS